MYRVMVKQKNADMKEAFSSHWFSETKDYANNNIVHGNNVERIEIHDHESCVDVVFDASWEKQP